MDFHLLQPHVTITSSHKNILQNIPHTHTQPSDTIHTLSHTFPFTHIKVLIYTYITKIYYKLKTSKNSTIYFRLYPNNNSPFHNHYWSCRTTLCAHPLTTRLKALKLQKKTNVHIPFRVYFLQLGFSS